MMISGLIRWYLSAEGRQWTVKFIQQKPTTREFLKNIRALYFESLSKHRSTLFSFRRVESTWNQELGDKKTRYDKLSCVHRTFNDKLQLSRRVTLRFHRLNFVHLVDLRIAECLSCEWCRSALDYSEASWGNIYSWCPCFFRIFTFAKCKSKR